MNIFNEINQAGLHISLAGEHLKIANPKKLTDGLRNLIRINKQEIIRQLSAAQHKQNIQEYIEERAAIMEYEGGLSREDAERAAAAAIRVFCYRVKDKPNSELVAIMPNTELDEAYESLRLRFGNRLLTVYENTPTPDKAESKQR